MAGLTAWSSTSLVLAPFTLVAFAAGAWAISAIRFRPPIQATSDVPDFAKAMAVIGVLGIVGGIVLIHHNIKRMSPETLGRWKRLGYVIAAGIACIVLLFLVTAILVAVSA